MAFLTKLLSKMRGESASIGIDLGHKSLKAVKIYHKAKKFYFVDKIELPIEEGVLVDGEINQPEILGGKIIDALEYLKYDKGFDDVFFSISWSSGILADRVHLKFPKGSDEEEVILFEAGNRPPFDEKDITLDYQILNSDSESETKEVLLVAAKNSVLQKWARFLETFSVHPQAFDVDSFSVYNTFSSMASEQERNESVAILNIGQQRGTVTFVQNGQYHSSRAIQGNVIHDMTKSLARKLNINTKDASDLLFGHSTPTAQGEKAIQSLVQDLARSIQQAIQYFQSTAKGESIKKIFLSGGGSYISVLPTVLNQEIPNISVEMMTFMGERAEDGTLVDPIYAVAYGLAMRNS